MVFSVDADEVLTPAMVAEIRALFAMQNVPRLINVKKAMIFPHHEPPPFGFCHDQILDLRPPHCPHQFQPELGHAEHC